MNKEIGSEFYEDESIDCKAKHNKIYLLSGRTALDFIIRDIKAKRSLKTIMMPSYCCESMLEPFLRNDIEIKYYSFLEDGFDYDFDNNCDAVLLLDFFGFTLPQNVEVAKKEKDKGKTVIYDSTHKISGNKAVCKFADYAFCSQRKWSYINSAELQKFSGGFNIPLPQKVNDKYIEIRERAREEKKLYLLSGKSDLKESFLRLYSYSEEIIEGDYCNYAAEPVSLPIKKIVSKRRQNAEYLIKELSALPQIKLYKTTLSKGDSPLFLPIFLLQEKREGLRKYLIENGVYCPVHWPISDIHNLTAEQKNIYNTELSLICDQRYNLSDMKRISQLIKKYFGVIDL